MLKQKQMVIFLLLPIMALVVACSGAGRTIDVQRDARTETYTEPLNGATSANITLDAEVGAIDIYVLENSDTLFEAQVTYVGEMTFNTSGAEDRTITLQNRLPAGSSINDTGNILRWRVGIHPDVALTLTTRGAVGDSTLNLSQLILRDLSVATDVGNFSIMLPSTGQSYAMNVETNVGNVRVTVPTRVGVRVVGSSSVGSVRVPQTGWTRESGGSSEIVGVSGTWATSDFAETDEQITINFVADVGSLTVQ